MISVTWADHWKGSVPEAEESGPVWGSRSEGDSPLDADELALLHEVLRSVGIEPKLGTRHTTGRGFAPVVAVRAGEL